LLLDLDDTLLDTNMGQFLPAYFQALAKHLGQWVNPEVMLSALMSGTQLMLANEDPSMTLQQVFEQDFYPKLGINKEKLREVIDDFYDNAFRLLGSLTSQRPGAYELVDWADAKGYRIVIATDPIFPRKAVYERIRWAGLDPDRFELISSYESFHFTKSHPAYYAELLGRLGWPDGPVLMAGNDEERDLVRAQELGLVTYQVDGAAATAGIGAAAKVRQTRAISRGSLIDLRRWLQSADPGLLEPSFRDRRATMAILASTPAVIQALAANLPRLSWKYEATPDDWALIEIICHLRDTEREVHHVQVRTLRDDAQPFVPRPDAAVWAKQRNYLDEDGPSAIVDFTVARLKTLRELNEAGPEPWQRPARHAIFGPTHFGEVIGFMADHDRLHIQQAWQTLRALA
jgi:FMN phosphatase YigB (HAD superfamily)